MEFSYAVIGSGRQGTAAAYDLAKNGDAKKVFLADLSLDRAKAAAMRLNGLLRKELVEPQALDVKNNAAVVEFLKQANAAVSAVPYHWNLGLAQAAVQAGTSFCDLGGNTEIVWNELRLDGAAREAGITIVPDCGMVPGLGTSVCMYGMSLVQEPEEIYLWDGGLPLDPHEPWKYVLTFHFEGLVNEYFGTTEFLRDGDLIEVPCFQEYELIEFPDPIGTLEAFTTAGGTSTAPRTFLGKLKTYQNKTLRYEGHCAQWKAFHDAGLLDLEPVLVAGKAVRPRDLLEAVLNPKIRAKPGEKDVCIIRSKCIGRSHGRSVEATVDLFDYYDDNTGFTAMERTTGWHAAIVANLMAHDQIKKGAVPVEVAVPGTVMMRECKSRGMQITQGIRET